MKIKGYDGDVDELRKLTDAADEGWGRNNIKPGPAHPQEDQLFKQSIDNFKQICKWNQAHNRCKTKYCPFAYCVDGIAGYVWYCNFYGEGNQYKEYKERIKGD